jgi:rhodanese-related sulfurtransferase
VGGLEDLDVLIEHVAAHGVAHEVDDAVELLREKGFNAKRLDEGYPEWMLEELPVERS